MNKVLLLSAMKSHWRCSIPDAQKSESYPCPGSGAQTYTDSPETRSYPNRGVPTKEVVGSSRMGPMKCSAFQHDNRPNSKFCEECAAPFSGICGSCGRELRPTAKFCDECGTVATPPPIAPGTPATIGWHELYAADWKTVFPFYENRSAGPRATP